MQAVMVVVNILLVLNALVLIVSVLMQDGNKSGLGAISGGAETFLGKTKAKSYEAKLQKITKIGTATFIVFAIAMTMMSARVNNTSSGASNTTPAATETAAPADEAVTTDETAAPADEAVTTEETVAPAETVAATEETAAPADAAAATEPEATPAA